MNTKYFKTVCLLMVIFGVLGVISNISTLSTLAEGTGVAAIILGLLSNALLAVGGAVGGKAAKTGDTDKAPLCRKISYALLAIAAVGFVVGIVESSGVTVPGLGSNLMLGMAVIIGLVSLILPVLYFLGAKKFGE